MSVFGPTKPTQNRRHKWRPPLDFDLPKHSKSIRPLILSASFDEILPLVWHCGGPFCVPAFSYVLRSKTGTFFVTLLLLQYPCFEALEACLETCLEACPKVFCSSSHGLATLELETCIETCLQYILHLLNFWFDNLFLSNMLTKESKACKRGASRFGEPDRGTPRTQNLLAQGQSEAHGDSKLQNTIVEVPAKLNLK